MAALTESEVPHRGAAGQAGDQAGHPLRRRGVPLQSGLQGDEISDQAYDWLTVHQYWLLIGQLTPDTGF